MLSKQESLAWGGLIAVMLLVGAAYGLQRKPEKSPAPSSLPVLSEVGQFQLTNQFGIRVGREELEGYVWLVDVIFSRCPGQCHQLSLQMAELQGKLPKGLPIRLISLTADPEYDSPAVLLRYGGRYGAESNRWLFLTGPKREVYNLAMQGLKFSVVENEDARDATVDELFIHSASFALVDRQGRLRSMVQAEDPDAVPRILRELRALAEESWK